MADISVDHSTRTAYISLTSIDRLAVSTEELDDGTLLDFGGSGEVIGIEMDMDTVLQLSILVRDGLLTETEAADIRVDMEDSGLRFE